MQCTTGEYPSLWCTMCFELFTFIILFVGLFTLQGIRIINLLDAAIYFSHIISLLPHTNLTNLTKTASLKARSCRLCRVFTNRMASTSVASALREIRVIRVRINHLHCKNI